MALSAEESALYEKAERYLQEKKWRRAEDLANLLARSHPQSWRAMHLLARSLAQQGSVDKTLAVAERIWRFNSNDKEALSYLASLYWQLGRPDKAALCSTRLATLDPANPNALDSLGLCKMAMNDLTEAASCFRAAISISSNVPNFHYHYGQVLEMQGQLAMAISAYRKALALKPESPEYIGAIANAHFRAGAPEEAVAALRDLEEISDLTVEEHVLYGEALLGLSRTDEALEHTQAALRKDGRHMAARLLRASILQYTGDHSKAEGELREIVRSEPEHPAPYFSLSQCVTFSEKDRHLIESMRAVAETKNASPRDLARLHLAMGSAFQDLEEYEEAMHSYDEANRILRDLSGKRFDLSTQSASIDRIATTFDQSFFDRNRSLGLQSELPVFIVGMPRSGTTLAEQILSSHPLVFGGGELHFWISEGLRALGPNMEINDAAAAELARGYLVQLQKLDPEATRVTDKMPYNYLWLGLIHILYPNGRIVHCRRHPVDTCISMYSSDFQAPPPYAHDKDNIVSAYRLYARLMAHWRRVLPPDRFCEVQYEELVGDPETVSRRLVSFCGLQWDEACIRPEKNARLVATSSHWQVRQPIYGSSVGRWKRYEPWLGAFRSLLDDPPEE